MNLKLRSVAIDTLFEVHSGDFHAIKELDPGTVPLVSCGDTNNGVVGYFDIPKEFTYQNAITVAYNGSWPLLTKFHPYRFGAKDDVAVLIPRSETGRETLIYVAVMLNRLTWRYSYGRKCFRQKLQNVTIPIPVIGAGKELELNRTMIEQFHDKALKVVLTRMSANAQQWQTNQG
jgi:hypothetical protein